MKWVALVLLIITAAFVPIALVFSEFRQAFTFAVLAVTFAINYWILKDE